MTILHGAIQTMNLLTTPRARDAAAEGISSGQGHQHPGELTPRPGTREPLQHQYFYTVPEAAAIFRVSTKTIWRMVYSEKLRVRRFGRRVLIPVTEVERWLREGDAHA